MELAAIPPRVAAGRGPFLEGRLRSGPCGAAIRRGQFRAEWGPAQSEQEWTKRQWPALKLRQTSAPGALVEGDRGVEPPHYHRVRVLLTACAAMDL